MIETRLALPHRSPKSVDRALHLHGAAAHAGDRVGDRDLASRCGDEFRSGIHRRERGLHAGLDFMRQASAVGVAQRNQRDPASIDRRRQASANSGLAENTVEEMLGVENRLVDVAFSET